MNVEFVGTKSIDFENYVDLISIDGKLWTYHMTKVEEPNVFGVKEKKEGNHIGDYDKEIEVD